MFFGVYVRFDVELLHSESALYGTKAQFYLSRTNDCTSKAFLAKPVSADVTSSAKVHSSIEIGHIHGCFGYRRVTTFALLRAKAH
jgi:hypothetical protein